MSPKPSPLHALLFLFVALVCTSLPAAEPIDAPRLDAFVERGMDLWKVPGMAVAVVDRESVVYMRGFGVTSIEDGVPVDEHTLFANASTTKAMVAAGILMLADDGLLTLDDPVTKYLPELRFGDPLLTRELTLRDLLTHRTGLPSTDFWSFFQEMPMDEQVRRLAEVEPVASLRARHIYQNTMYELIGLVIERVSGQRWDRFLTQRLWQPIGMDETYGSRGQIPADKVHVLPHRYLDEKLSIEEWDLPADMADAAGSAWTSIHDMGLWAQFLLRGGVTASGERLISETRFADFFRPQHLIATADFYPTTRLTQPHWTDYALGWFQQDFQGRMIDFHTGSLSGLIAIIGLDRDGDRAVVVLGNRDHAEMRHAVLWEVMDTRPAADRPDWNGDIYALYQANEEEAEKRWQEAESKRLRGTHPSLPLASYAGTYHNAVLGNLDIVLEGKRLQVKAARMNLPISHWHVDTFLVEYAPWQMREFLEFRLGADGRIQGFGLFGEEFSVVPDSGGEAGQD